jgi:hypothetical protein
VPSGSDAGYVMAATGSRNVWLARTIGRFEQTANASLLQWNGRWQTIKVPFRTTFIEQLASDGHGGKWMIAQRGSFPADRGFLYHYNSGHWTSQPFPSRPNARTVINTITWIPGTRSLWATGELLGKGGSSVGVTEVRPVSHHRAKRSRHALGNS